MPITVLQSWYLCSHCSPVLVSAVCLIAVLRSASRCYGTANRAHGQKFNHPPPVYSVPWLSQGGSSNPSKFQPTPRTTQSQQSAPQGTPKPPSWTSLGSHFGDFLVTFSFSSGKRRTCDPLEPARSDCMSGGPEEVQFHHFLINMLGS